jgi:hypothetical protein
MRLATLAWVLCLSMRLVAAQTVQKWQTPEGTLYFGDKPPAGSKLIGETESLGAASSPEMTRPVEVGKPTQTRAETESTRRELRKLCFN